MSAKKRNLDDGGFSADQRATIETLRTIVTNRVDNEKAAIRAVLDSFDHDRRHDLLSAMLDLALEHKVELLGEDNAEELIGLAFQRLKRQLRGQLH